jgi:Carboxypeptidase regulatory-like domain
MLVGSVTKGPLSPVEQPGGAPSSLGVAGARIDIATAKGNLLTSVVTDSGGTFRVKLPPGTYKLTMPSLYGAMFTKDLPAIVTIAAGEVKRIDIHLDTGIR